MRLPKAPQSFAPVRRTQAQMDAVHRKIDEAVERGRREKRAAEKDAAEWILTVRARKAAK